MPLWKCSTVKAMSAYNEFRFSKTHHLYEISNVSIIIILDHGPVSIINVSIQVRFMRFVITRCWQVCRYSIAFKHSCIHYVCKHVHVDINIFWIWETAIWTPFIWFCLWNLCLDGLLLRYRRHNEYLPIIYCFHFGIFGLLSFNCRLFSEKRGEGMEKANEMEWKVQNVRKAKWSKTNSARSEISANGCIDIASDSEQENCFAFELYWIMKII